MRTLSFSHDGKMLASASEDHFIDIAEVETGNCVIAGLRPLLACLALHPAIPPAYPTWTCLEISLLI